MEGPTSAVSKPILQPNMHLKALAEIYTTLPDYLLLFYFILFCCYFSFFRPFRTAADYPPDTRGFPCYFMWGEDLLGMEVGQRSLAQTFHIWRSVGAACYTPPSVVHSGHGKSKLSCSSSFSFLLFGATDQGAPVRCVTEPATTVNSWRESTLLCEIFGSSLGSNPCRQPTTSSKAGQRASACREKNKRLPMRRSQT